MLDWKAAKVAPSDQYSNTATYTHDFAARKSTESLTFDTRMYDDGGRMTPSSYNNGASESRAYNTDNTLASKSFTGEAIGDLSYGWDANKNKTCETIGVSDEQLRVCSRLQRL